MAMCGITWISIMYFLFGQTSSDTLPTLSLSSFDTSYSSYYASSSSEHGHSPPISSSSSKDHPVYPFISRPPSSLSSSPMQLAMRIKQRPNPQLLPHQSRLYLTQRSPDSPRHYEDEDDENYPNYYDEDERIDNDTSPLDNLKPRGPFFASDNSTLKVYLGSTATLECTVLELTNESVSWVRVVDDKLELLTFGSHKYTTDERYTLVRKIGDTWQKWQLEIRDTREEDQGQYRCQISTQPPMLMSLALDITEPVARVVDERGRDIVDKHYNSGSMIELKCIIEKVPFPHEAVTWRRGNTPLRFNTSRGGISVKMNKESNYIRSRLYVANASSTDSGVYSCWYSNYTSDNVTVHVITGENSQAMQDDSVPETPTTSGSRHSHDNCSNWSYLSLFSLVISCYPFFGAIRIHFISHISLFLKKVAFTYITITTLVREVSEFIYPVAITVFMKKGSRQLYPFVKPQRNNTFERNLRLAFSYPWIGISSVILLR